MIVKTDAFRVWFDESGEPIGMMIENGHDTMYTIKRATKADKDQLLERTEPLV